MRQPMMLVGAGAAGLALAMQTAALALPGGPWAGLLGYAGAPLILVTLVAMIWARRRLESAERHSRRLAEAIGIDPSAFRDDLTGLPNRALFVDHLRLALPQAKRLGTKVAVLFLNLDRFEIINESLGRSAGDRLLRAVAARLRCVTRQGDTVARFGGDEFCVLAQGVRRVEDSLTIARKLKETVRSPFMIEAREIFLTTSIGVSLYPDDGAEGEALIHACETAMHRAKKKGIGSHQLYTTAMNTEAVERFELENDLRQALARDQLVLHYQPIVDITTGEVQACEALLRWRHPERGLLAPAKFLAVAEITGLIVSMGIWILRTACAQVQTWHHRGLPFLTVAVNLSPCQLAEPDLVQRVEEALERTGLDPDHLELEITESVAMENAEATIETLRGLKTLGVGLSIDDFGTGYSSLSYLRRFPIDTLKIDRSFVRDIHTSKEDAAITASVVAIARVLDLHVVAEGVETKQQLRVVRGQGCEKGQGYLFSRPVPATEFASLLGRS